MIIKLEANKPLNIWGRLSEDAFAEVLAAPANLWWCLVWTKALKEGNERNANFYTTWKSYPYKWSCTRWSQPEGNASSILVSLTASVRTAY